MREDLKPIYRFILRHGVVTTNSLMEAFRCSENLMKKKINTLVEGNYVKPEMIQNPMTGRWIKAYKSPVFDHE